MIGHASADVRLGEDLVDGVFAIEEGGSLFKGAAFGFDDVDVAEDRLNGQPAYVYNLWANT